MAFQVSPGVQVNEIDLTNVVPATSTSIGGYAGAFNWGPAGEIVTVSSEKELATVFGAPTAATARSFLTAASFLKYAANLKVVRAFSSTALNATTGSGGNSGLLIPNKDVYENSYADGQGDRGIWGAKYLGSIGNSLKVSVCSANATAFNGWVDSVTGASYKGLFSSVPGTSTDAAKYGSTNDELHIVVIDEDGAISGTPGTVLEKFEFVSQASGATKPDGTSNYYKDVINNNSGYIWWLDHSGTFTNAGTAITTTTAFGTSASALETSLIGGTDVTPTAGDVSTALDVLKDVETVDVNLVFTAGDAAGTATVANALVAFGDFRKDCVVFVSAPIESSVGQASPAASVVTWTNTLSARNSYTVIDSGAVKVYDKYNDTNIWITAAGHLAGLCARTDNVADAWFSPAGFTRGQILGITKLAYNPKQADRDTLYKAGINPIVSFPGQGTCLYGDKTALLKPSAFDRINVRRLFNVLEKSISTAAKYQLFELNDEFTRAMFRNMVEPFLRDVQGRRGITDFKVVCDETNNTGDVIDRNEFRADIYIKPARSINYITLNFIATRTGVQFSELVGN